MWNVSLAEGKKKLKIDINSFALIFQKLFEAIDSIEIKFGAISMFNILWEFLLLDPRPLKFKNRP